VRIVLVDEIEIEIRVLQSRSGLVNASGGGKLRIQDVAEQYTPGLSRRSDQAVASARTVFSSAVVSRVGH
jgi:hypothetical protein